ncbi:hypothetical protein [Rubritalea tangerina]|uniref:hypothetical protein n=1 Tax=Rubritalea tangerina TaxID=430798 RepID=UPI0036236E92
MRRLWCVGFGYFETLSTDGGCMCEERCLMRVVGGALGFVDRGIRQFVPEIVGA